MKTTITLMAMLLCFCLLSPLSAQEEKKGQLYYCYEETVNPGYVNEYFEYSKEMLELCKETNFPFPFYTWSNGEFKFQLWTPINSLDDIDIISESWNKVIKELGKEKYAKFNETKPKSFSFTIRGQADLHYQPENPRYNEGENTFCKYREYYIVSGKMNEAKGIIKEFSALLQSKNYDNPWFFYNGGIGCETPVIIGVTYGLNSLDYLEQDKRFQELFGEEIKDLNKRWLSCLSSTKNKELYWREDLTYIPEE